MLVVEVRKKKRKKRAETESKTSSSGTSSSDSDKKPIHCLMTNAELKIKSDEVFDFSSNEFTHEDLFMTLLDMVNEYKRLAVIQRS